MKKITFLIVLFATVASAQELTVLTGGTLSMNSGALLYFDGMELQPSINYDLKGPNNFTSLESPLPNPQGIGKFIEFSNPITNYTGKVVLYYQSSDLNELEELDLKLATKDSETAWDILDSNLDLDLKKMNFTFENPVTLYGLTATRKQTLSNASFDEATLKIFPNPTTSILQINYKNDLQIEVYDFLGSSLLKTDNKSIDLSNFSTGTYLIKISDLKTNSSLFKKIIKN